MEDSTNNTGNDRQLQPVRTPISTRTVGNAPDAQPVSTFDRMSQRGVNRVIETYDVLPVQQAGNTDYANHAIEIQNPQLADYGQPDLTINKGVSSSGQTQQPVTPYYDISNPLGLSADLFSKFFSAAPTEGPQSPVLVGDTGISTSKGSNAGLLLLLAVVAIGGYFIYRRMKQ